MTQIFTIIGFDPSRSRNLFSFFLTQSARVLSIWLKMICRRMRARADEYSSHRGIAIVDNFVDLLIVFIKCLFLSDNGTLWTISLYGSISHSYRSILFHCIHTHTHSLRFANWQCCFFFFFFFTWSGRRSGRSRSSGHIERITFEWNHFQWGRMDTLDYTAITDSVRMRRSQIWCFAAGVWRVAHLVILGCTVVSGGHSIVGARW